MNQLLNLLRMKATNNNIRSVVAECGREPADSESEEQKNQVEE